MSTPLPAIGRFLKVWRAQRDPNQVPGFTARFGPRNKPGIKQVELAQLTGVSTTWVRDLEHGRANNPSVEWLQRIVRILDLTPAQRHALFVYATNQEPPLLYRPDASNSTRLPQPLSASSPGRPTSRTSRGTCSSTTRRANVTGRG